MAWPSIRRTFDLPVSQLGALLATAMVGYLVSAFSSGSLVGRLGVGRLLLWSSIAMVASSLGYALAPAWPVMLALGVVSGLGAGAIDAGINAFAAARFAPRTVNWLHACYGVGAALGPLLLTALMTAGFSWRWGYGLIAAALAGMAACFAATVGLWSAARGNEHAGSAATPAPAGDVSTAPASGGVLDALRRPEVQMGVALFFVYTGLEATAGQWSYSLLTESRGIAMATAGAGVAAYWGGLTAGRLLFGGLARRHRPEVLLRVGLAAAPVAIVALWLVPGAAGGVLALAVLGLAVAPIYPLLISLTPARVGPVRATHAVGFQVAAAYLGAAALPGLGGVLARALSLEAIPPFMAVTALVALALNELAGRRREGAELPPTELPGAERAR